MKKLLLLFAMVVGCLGIAHAETYTANSTDIASPGSAPTSWTSNGVTWTMSYTWDSSSYTGTDGSKGFQIGSSKKACKTFTVSTSEIQGTISSVKVNSSIASSGTAQLSVKVGPSDFTYVADNATSVAPTTTPTNYEFTGSASGEIKITITNTAKAFYIKSITVEYATGEAVELGVLSATCNGEAVAETLTIEEGTPINFLADHATSFEVTVDNAAPVVLTAENGSASWTPEVCADANVSVVAKRNVGEDNQTSEPLIFTLTVNKALYSKATWIVTGTTKTGDEYTLKLGEGSSAGVWHLSAGSYYGAINGGAQLGSSNNPFTDGTITLSDSDIPANAIINEITFTGRTNSAYTLAVTVNGQSAGNIEVQTTEQDHTLTGLELAGNEIVFTTNTDATKYLCVKGISVKYTVPEPELDGEASVEVFHHKDGGFMTVEYSFYVKNYDATQHTIEVLATVEGLEQEVVFTEVNAEKAPSRAASESTLFTASLKSNTHEALTGKDKNPTVRVKATVKGGKELFNVTKTNAYDISGIEGVEAEANEGEAVYYNLQGQRVEANQPGLYIRKANGKVSKVVIR